MKNRTVGAALGVPAAPAKWSRESSTISVPESSHPLTLLPHAHAVLREGKKIPLRKKEFELLEFMTRNRRRAINRLTILEYVWDYGTTSITNTLEVHMASLRRKMDNGFSSKLFRTVPGGHYMMN